MSSAMSLASTGPYRCSSRVLKNWVCLDSIGAGSLTPIDLDEFVAHQEPVGSSSVRWRNPIELDVSGYLSAQAPPVDLVSSVRAVVLNGDRVLVMRNLDGTHILPGGRVEEGETAEETLRRELLEEAGVEIEVKDQVGFVHLKHTTPKPKDYPHLYPDFFWPVFAASFVRFQPGAKVEDDYEVSSEFLPIRTVRGLALESHENAFLEGAISVLQGGGQSRVRGEHRA